MAQEHLATVDLMRLTDLLHDAREQLALMTSERDRLAEALKKIASGASYDRGIMDGKSFASFPYIARTALDKDA